MKSTVKTILFAIVFMLAMVSVKPAKAQCSQCAAQVATSSANGNNAAKGLNMGIYILLAAPYLAVGMGGFVWYRNYKRKNVRIDMPESKLHLN